MRTSPRSIRVAHSAASGAGGQADECGLIDEPGGHCQAREITSGSARSSTSSANRARSSTLTGAPGVAASWARRRRTYSLRDRPRRPACASSAAPHSALPDSGVPPLIAVRDRNRCWPGRPVRASQPLLWLAWQGALIRRWAPAAIRRWAPAASQPGNPPSLAACRRGPGRGCCGGTSGGPRRERWSSRSGRCPRRLAGKRSA